MNKLKARKEQVMDLADKIQKLRKEKEMTQAELAEKLLVSRQAISKWENGIVVPDIENIIAISELFSVSVDYLVTNNDSKEKSKSLDVELKTINRTKKEMKNKKVIMAIIVGIVFEIICTYMKIALLGIVYILWGIVLWVIYHFCIKGICSGRKKKGRK